MKSILPEIIQVLASGVGSFGFALLFNIRGWKALYAAIGGLVGWAVYLACEALSGSEYLGGFAAAIVITLFAEGMARVCKTPVTVFLVSAAIPLFPGAALYRAMNALMQRQYALAADQSVYALMFAASLSAGITLTTVVFRVFGQLLFRQRRL